MLLMGNCITGVDTYRWDIVSDFSIRDTGNRDM